MGCLYQGRECEVCRPPTQMWATLLSSNLGGRLSEPRATRDNTSSYNISDCWTPITCLAKTTTSGKMQELTIESGVLEWLFGRQPEVTLCSWEMLEAP
ncbi:hypothetical protein HNY73_002533 [Argiope bruennichi]|uniref:Uncharacterized protein n=1 Tax=Argiope bruennichi TaxID=94029 RepID=A0A8T0FV40_ARGBR|nr:hypothetical protein HNY73_002533 [Argiope bruennichi]